MEKYIVVVRDYEFNRPTDKALRFFDCYFQSPVVELDFMKNRDKAMDFFDAQYRQYFSHFLNFHYELIPQ